MQCAAAEVPHSAVASGGTGMLAAVGRQKPLRSGDLLDPPPTDVPLLFSGGLYRVRVERLRAKSDGRGAWRRDPVGRKPRSAAHSSVGRRRGLGDYRLSLGVRDRPSAPPSSLRHLVQPVAERPDSCSRRRGGGGGDPPRRRRHRLRERNWTTSTAPTSASTRPPARRLY